MYSRMGAKEIGIQSPHNNDRELKKATPHKALPPSKFIFQNIFHTTIQDKAKPCQHIRINFLHVIPKPLIHHFKPCISGPCKSISVHSTLFQKFPQADMNLTIVPHLHHRLVFFHILTSQINPIWKVTN